MTTRSEIANVQRATALAAARRILSAMATGKLPDTLRVEFTGWSQVILHTAMGEQGTTPETLAALERMFRVKPQQTRTGWFARGRPTRRNTRVEEAHVVFELGETKTVGFTEIKPARVEVWDAQVPHICRSPKGAVEGGRAVWRCGISGCNRIIPAERIREEHS